MNSDCKLCRGKRHMYVLDLWLIEARRAAGMSKEEVWRGHGADELPFVVIENACPDCCGEEAFTKATTELGERKRANPWPQ